MRFIVPPLLVLAAAYGAAIVWKPQLAVRRNQVASPVKIWITRLKGVIVLGMSLFMLWRTQN